MNTAKRRVYLAMLKVFNLGLMIAAFGITTILQIPQRDGGVPLSAFLSIRVKVVNFVIFCLLLLAWHAIFSLCGQYRSQRLARLGTIIWSAIRSTTIASLFLGVVAMMFGISMVTPVFLFQFWICASLLVTGSRLLMRGFLGFVRLHGRNLRYILILGTNKRAIEFARRLETTPEWGYRALGFVDHAWHVSTADLERPYPLCCSLDELSDYLRRNVVDEIANYLPLRSFYENSFRIASLCEQHGICMRFDPKIFDLKIARAHAEELDGRAHITAYPSSLDGWPALVKRFLDVILSLVLLVAASPILLIVGLMIKLTSKGPIFFFQERIGRNKRRFFIYKFRTMVPNAEKLLPALEVLNEAGGPVFKIRNDPRITPIGRLLRRTSLDELPQLFNVLRGDMSLVGPRPLPLRDYEGFDQDWQRRRFSVRPGITCLWQVNGRSNIGFEHWMKLDLQYLDEWSIWLDMKILARTIPAVLRGSGAA
ncbi:MAG TPA: sugar transferase [Terriglobales bacterium]|nr:sugar transferase [Terriglobales bacterium]